jgi:hypothetical protein
LPKLTLERLAATGVVAAPSPSGRVNQFRKTMRIYSEEELDVMAEAYIRALEKMPDDISSPEVTQKLVEEIGMGVASGIRDEDALASAAVESANLGL